MRHGRKSARVCGTSQIESLPHGAMRGGRKIHKDGDDEVSPTQTGGSESRALLDRSMGDSECFASSSIASTPSECRAFKLT